MSDDVDLEWNLYHDLDNRYLGDVNEIARLEKLVFELSGELERVSNVLENETRMRQYYVDKLVRINSVGVKQKRLRCGECGSFEVAKKDVKGEFFPYMSEEKLELLVSLDLSVCKCGNILLCPGDCKALDEKLKESLLMLKERKKEIIKGCFYV